MKPNLRFAAALLIASALPASLAAYDLNPLVDRYRAGTGQSFRDRITDTVHEDITHAAVACTEQAPQADPLSTTPLCSVPVTIRRQGTGNFGDALIRGVWWNDDPNQLLYAAGYATWYAWMKDGKSIAKRGRNLRGQPMEIGPTYKMLYRSHFGDLQFLHAMATTNGEKAIDTQAQIIAWTEFAYKVAIGEIPADRELQEVNLPFIQTTFANQPGWTVSHLFAPKYVLRGRPVGELALGSILHLVQDSFAGAHAERSQAPSVGCSSGRITQFYSYADQDADLHSAEDTRASLAKYAYPSVQNPMEASARLILFARNKTDWSRHVEPYLRQHLFCVGADSIESGPGRFAERAPRGT